MNSKVSIIVPIYNSEKYLERCIDSLLKQSLKNIEIILVNDGSTDNSGKLCQKYEKENKNVFFIDGIHKGQGYARNIGLKKSTGDYVTFVDSDDYVNENMCEVLYGISEQNNCDVSFCDYISTKKTIKKINRTNEINILDKDQALRMFFRENNKKNYYGVHGKLIKKTLLSDFNFLENKMNEDILFTYTVFEKSNKIAFINESLYYYFINENSLTYRQFNLQKTDLLYVWDIVLSKVSSDYPEYKQLCEQNCVRARFTLLAKMKIDGFERNDKDLVKLNKNLKKYVRSHYFELLKINMSLSRKVLLTILII